jgi:LysM repeat protein
MTTRDPDDDVEYVDDEEEEDEPRRRSPLRLIILILLALVGLCIICFLASRLLGGSLLGALPIPIPGLPSAEPIVTSAPVDTPTLALTVPSTETTEPPPTSELPGGTTEPAPTSEQPVVTEEPSVTEEPAVTEEPVVTEEPSVTEEPLPTVEPTAGPIDEHGGDIPIPTEEAPTATTVPVPGPTATPTFGPTPATTVVADCTNNAPPNADAGAPTSGMMGKGQAFVTVDGSGSSDPDGTIVRYEWDFGDGSASEEGQSVTHGYSGTGVYVITLTVTDDCGATAQDTADVTITGPTPPATPAGTVEPTPAATDQPQNSTAGTFGFCYRVQPGNTLTGIARYFGVSVPTLAEVNGVRPTYYVYAGQGLFIPTGEIVDGPNLYEVQAGDTLNSIAFQCGLSKSRLAGANGLASDQSLTPGQLLGIPLWSWY